MSRTSDPGSAGNLRGKGLLLRNQLVRDDEFLARLRKAHEREPPALRAVSIRACYPLASLSCSPR